MGFLQKIALKFLSEYGTDIRKIAFVFPTRRAGIYFLRHLQQQKEENLSLWAPPIFSIDDFVAGLSGLTIPDQPELIFTLFDIYREKVHSYPKEFADFYSWGKMIIADFNDIDKHLVDTEKLFRVLTEYKSVEDINKEEKAEIYKKYTGFWGELALLYREFNRTLKEKNRAYDGMAYRVVALQINNLVETANPAWEKVVFCGFNALTAAEQAIINYLLKEGKGEIYWDMDRYFVEDVNQEAGYFFRQNRDTTASAEALWVEDRLSQKKTIDIIGVQSRIGQAKVLGICLQQLLQSEAESEDIAVVLPDESLLFPVLNSLPQSVARVNITIGFPLEQTPVYSLFNSLIEMQLRVLESRGEKAGEFYYKDVQKVLNHPYIKPFAPDKINGFMTRIKSENLVYITSENIELLPQPLPNLFNIRENSRQMIESFLELLLSIRSFYRENKPDLFSIDYEYLYHFFSLLTRLQDILKNSGPVMDIGTFRRLFADIVKNSRIPFTGEPLEGMQIMGVLETQTLNFSHLYVLSLNEGYLPPGKSQQSFIPYEARMAVGLPTYKERDAVSAYHFYRLLKNSQHITLFYTGEAKGMEKNEKSRFIDQLLIEFSEKNPETRICHQVIDFSFSARSAKEFSIEKSLQVIDRLAQRVYSASSLLDYLTCSLKFYFSHILKLKEEEEVYESPDQRLVGDIIHKTLSTLYHPYNGRDKVLSLKEIVALKNKVEAVLTTVYGETLKSGDLHTGRNRIVFEVMKRFLYHFFDKEKQSAGFKILMLEERIENIFLPFSVKEQEYQVRLVGYIDRVDIDADFTCRIIDYKTGKVNPLNLKSLSELSGPEAARRREVFQLFFYRYLLKRTWGKSRPYQYRLGIYPFKKIYDDLKFVSIDKADIIVDEMVAEYEQILVRLFQELFDPAIPFTRTTEEKNCSYCPYVHLCGRNTEDYR